VQVVSSKGQVVAVLGKNQLWSFNPKYDFHHFYKKPKQLKACQKSTEAAMEPILVLDINISHFIPTFKLNAN
jgi:hypothetical protein